MENNPKKVMHSQSPAIQKIIRRIKYKRSDTILNYLRSIAGVEIRDFSGNVSPDSFVVWKYSWWSGIFFAVVYGKINSIEKHEFISLKVRMNPVGRIAAGTIFLLLAFGWFNPSPGIITSEFRFILSGILFISCFMLGIFGIYAKNKKRLLEEIKEILVGQEHPK